MVGPKRRAKKKFKRSGKFCVYIVECKDGTYYTGYTPDIDQRIKLHNSGKGAKYTRGRGPAKLVWKKEFKYFRLAVREESRIKALTRQQKENLLMKNYTFATAINCIDGRTQEPLIKFLKKKLGVDYIDLITEPGVDQVLSQYKDKRIIASIKKSVRISVEKHNSKMIVITGHHDCAANPATTTKHLTQIKTAVARLSKWGFNVPVLGVWIDKKFQVKVAKV